MRYTMSGSWRFIRLLSLLLMVAVMVWVGEGDLSAADGRNWSELPDFAALRKEIGWQSDYLEKCEDGNRIKEIRVAFESKNSERVIALSEPFLATCPIHIPTHYYRALALRDAGRTAEGKWHYDWFAGLIESILASGDGKSSETAYVTISVSEEYVLLSYLGLKLKSQGLVPNPPRDRFVVEDEDRKEWVIWFNPAAHFARMNDLVKKFLEEKKSKSE